MFKYIAILTLVSGVVSYYVFTADPEKGEGFVFENIINPLPHSLSSGEKNEHSDPAANRKFSLYQKKEVDSDSISDETSDTYGRFETYLSLYLKNESIEILEKLVNEGVEIGEFTTLLTLIEEALLGEESLFKRQKLKSLYRWVGELYIDYLHEKREEGALRAFVENYLDSIDDKAYAKEIKTKLKRIDALQTTTATQETDKILARIPLIRYENQFLIDATLEGVSYRLLLDTGSNADILLDTEAAERFSDQNGKAIEISVVGGHIKAMRLESGTLVLDDITLLDVDVIAATIHSDAFEGLIGMGVLGRFVFKIDQNNNQLVLYQWR